MSLCRSCGAPVVWVTTEAGKKMPMDAEGSKVWIFVKLDDADLHARQVDGYQSHFATCPDANGWRKKGDA